MAIRAGRLRHYVVVEQPVKTTDATGGESIAWSTYASTWAAIEPLRPLKRQGEIMEAGQFAAPVIATIILRYFSGLTTEMRINHNGTYYNIRSISNVDTRNRVIELMATYGDANHGYST